MADPFQILSVECASAILKHLSVSDIARCESVSRGWALFVRQWMVSPGLRLHFLHELPLSDHCNLENSVRFFKEQAAVQKSIGRGEPSAVRKFETAKAFTIAGKYCAWINDKDGVFWQDLSYRSDGELHPGIKLNPTGVHEALHEPGELVLLGANGHLLIRYNVQPPPSGTLLENARDTLFCLESGSQVWSHAYQRHEDDGPRYVPVMVGEKRAYFGSVTHGDGPAMIKAHALLSGELLYETDTIVPHTNCFYGMDDTKSYRFGHPLELLDVEGDEVILAFKTQRGLRERLATIYLINGEDGSLRQKTRVILIGPSYVRVSPSRTGFSIISHAVHQNLLKVETFSRQSSGQFVATRVDTVLCKANLLCLDPFTSRVLTVDNPRLDSRPLCSSLVEVINSDTLSQMQAARSTYFTFPGQCDDGLHLTATDASRVSLLPLSKRARLRRPFPQGPRAAHLRFADGHRAVMECTDGTIYLFDFAPGRY
ncbi:hypothetical protein ASPCAL04847 [Aspergillus calidoustus]|uniref:Uncharacterized protein n=1 Tax=Aspergillus calidoustus TaxID=454130 RepID=A0A0U4Z254_ASPCI|nr:hypothetical protein ASPCAL04847 [Aspergillus calidoustus]